MTPQDFIAKWKPSTLSERAACQEHFLDLCRLLGQPTPAEADPAGDWYTFERGVEKTGGGDGWADVWMRGHFGWEYKGKRKDLAAAYDQLLLYREALENPPLLVVCDMDRFEVHTNFTGTVKRVYSFNLAGLAQPGSLLVLRKLFTEPEALRPDQTTAGITEEAAGRFKLIADGLRSRGVPPDRAAHFLMKVIFCMFGQDIGLLPTKVFQRTLVASKNNPDKLARSLKQLFEAMSTGGNFGPDEILHFNGGLFADAEVVPLTAVEIDELVRIDQYDWANVEPSIFGTLFERLLDPAKRLQIGAHYTSRQDIETLLEPVLMAPLRREWADVQARCDALRAKLPAANGRVRQRAAKPPKARQDHDRLLLDLEKQVIAYAATHGVSLLPHVRPTQLSGIEINPFAQELAQVVIWIGYLQWMHFNGFNPPRDPVLAPIDSIKSMDAILDLSDPANPKEPDWPAADFIVGNPPFLGDKLMRGALGDEYVTQLRTAFEGRVPGGADLCCYWFEKARAMIKAGVCKRAGLLATQGIRGPTNRKVLQRIKATGNIFWAESDRDWILDGAAVHVSIVAFDNGAEAAHTLDGRPVLAINSDLSHTVDKALAKRLPAKRLSRL